MSAKKLYVLGFLFDLTRRKVVLIKKGKRVAFPWMEGLHNGVGGAVNTGELPEDAM